jgi:hypothetical protein
MADPIDDLIKRLHRMQQVAVTAGPAIADAVQAEIRSELASGRAPDGSSWAPKKKGGRPLPNAAKAVSVSARGSLILVKAEHPYGFHQAGAGKLPRRAVIPTQMTAPIALAISRVLDAHAKAAASGV